MVTDTCSGASHSDHGVALVVSLLATALIAAIGLGLVTMSTTERVVATNARESLDGLYAAEAVVEHVLNELWDASDWNDVVGGLRRSSFLDSSTTPMTATGPIDLISVTVALQARADDEGRWGPNNPAWRLFAYGSLAALVGGDSVGTPVYLVAWIADDPAELDGDPARDSNGVLLVRGRSVGRGGLVREVQITLKRGGPYSSAPPGSPGSGIPAVASPSGALARIMRDSGEVVGSRQVTSSGMQILAWREVR